MKLIQKIKDIIFKVKDYDRIENDYSSVLDYATGGILSKTNYTLDSVYEGIQHNLQKHDEYVFMDFMEKAENAISMISRHYIGEDYSFEQVWEQFKNYMENEN